MEDVQKVQLFEHTPVPKAVMKLAIPTIVSSLVMVIYNLADTYFVGMLNDPVQNAAVTLAAPVLLAFNAVNNLFGVGASSMMSRALGRKDYDTVYGSSALGFYCALLFAALFSVFYTAFHTPFLNLLGADAATSGATAAYLKWPVSFHLECCDGLSCAERGFIAPCKYRHHERMSAQYFPGSDFYFALGAQHESGGRRTGNVSFQLCGMRVFFPVSVF